MNHVKDAQCGVITRKWFKDCEYQGNDVKTGYNIWSHTECFDLCLRTKQCTHWTYYPDYNLCSMKKGPVSINTLISKDGIFCGISLPCGERGAYDEWQEIALHDARDSANPHGDKFEYEKTTGMPKSGSKTISDGIEKMASIVEGMSTNLITGFNWNNRYSSAYSKETTNSIEATCPQGACCTILQIVGHCGEFTYRTSRTKSGRCD